MKVLLVDDEITNLDHLRTLLQTCFPQVVITGEAQNAADAAAMMHRQQPDLVLLDIQMPGESGLELIERLSSVPFAVIFVTAHDQYAIQAIRLSALDYLLKPVQLKELGAAIRRAEADLQHRQQASQINLLVENLHTRQEHRKIALPQGDGIRLVLLSAILYCECVNNYTHFFVQHEKKITVSKGLYEFEQTLAEAGFIRCHNSYFVNEIHIRALRKSEGLSHLELTDGTMIPVARLRKEAVKKRLEKFLKHL